MPLLMLMLILMLVPCHIAHGRVLQEEKNAVSGLDRKYARISPNQAKGWIGIDNDNNNDKRNSNTPSWYY